MSRTGRGYWVSLLFFLVGLLKTSITKSLLSKHGAEVTGLGRGQLQGAISSMTSISQIISPIILSRAYSYFISSRAPFQLPGVPFWICTYSTLSCMGILSTVSDSVFAKQKDLAHTPKSIDRKES